MRVVENSNPSSSTIIAILSASASSKFSYFIQCYSPPLAKSKRRYFKFTILDLKFKFVTILAFRKHTYLFFWFHTFLPYIKNSLWSMRIYTLTYHSHHIVVMGYADTRSVIARQASPLRRKIRDLIQNVISLTRPNKQGVFFVWIA